MLSVTHYDRIRFGMRFDLRKLEHALAVAKFGSYWVAAEQLGLSAVGPITFRCAGR